MPPWMASLFTRYNLVSIAQRSGLDLFPLMGVALGYVDPTRSMSQALRATYQSLNYNVLRRYGFTSLDALRYSGKSIESVTEAADYMYNYAAILAGVHGKDPYDILNGMRRSSRWGYEDWEFYIETTWGIPA